MTVGLGLTHWYLWETLSHQYYTLDKLSPLNKTYKGELRTLLFFQALIY